MCVTAKILKGVAETAKGFFYKRAPVFSVKEVFEFFPFVRIPQLFTGRGKYQLAAFIKGIQFSKIFPPEFVPEDLYRDEKMMVLVNKCVGTTYKGRYFSVHYCQKQAYQHKC